MFDGLSVERMFVDCQDVCSHYESLRQGNRISFLELALQAASQQASFQNSAVQMRSISRLII